MTTEIQHPRHPKLSARIFLKTYREQSPTATIPAILGERKCQNNGILDWIFFVTKVLLLIGLKVKPTLNVGIRL